MGLDARSDTGIERKIVFGVDGPSLIRAELSNASGSAKVCLWKGNQVQARQCDDIRNGVLERATLDAGSSNWTLTLISTSTTGPVTVDLAGLEGQATDLTFITDPSLPAVPANSDYDWSVWAAPTIEP